MTLMQTGTDLLVDSGSTITTVGTAGMLSSYAPPFLLEYSYDPPLDKLYSQNAKAVCHHISTRARSHFQSSSNTLHLSNLDFFRWKLHVIHSITIHTPLHATTARTRLPCILVSQPPLTLYFTANAPSACYLSHCQLMVYTPHHSSFFGPHPQCWPARTSCFGSRHLDSPNPPSHLTGQTPPSAHPI
jgi:hypothetical protein